MFIRKNIFIITAFLGATILLNSCRSSIVLPQQDIEYFAYWIEDVCHGDPRRPEELYREHASALLLKLAEWMDESRSQYPEILQRRNRWPLMREALKQGQIIRGEDGSFSVEKTLEVDDRKWYRNLLLEELRDRERIVSASVTTAGYSMDQPSGQAIAAIMIRIQQLRDEEDVSPSVADK